MKSHFTFTKKQRNGIFLLVLLIIILQSIYFFVDFPQKEVVVNHEELNRFKKEIDSLRAVEIESRKPKIFPFNPNYITDYKGATLGMSNEEIDRLLAYRKQGKWINSSKQFQEVTKISDSLLGVVSPYFKFPEWIANAKTNTSSYNNLKKISKTFKQKRDLNKATVRELQEVSGIGEVLSNRIVKFRNKFAGGFIADIQLTDVYGLTPELITRITSEFTVKTPRVVKRLNVNTATVEELVTIQHIDYELANTIIEQRVLREGFKTIDELIKVKDFPVNKIGIIELYLYFE